MTYEGMLEILVPLVLGLIGSPTVIQWLKDVLKIQDRWALLLALLISALLAIGALFLANEFAGFEWSSESIFQAIALVFTATQLTYRLLNPTSQS